jgi:hypothetical protein
MRRKCGHFLDLRRKRRRAIVSTRSGMFLTGPAEPSCSRYTDVWSIAFSIMSAASISSPHSVVLRAERSARPGVPQVHVSGNGFTGRIGFNVPKLRIVMRRSHMALALNVIVPVSRFSGSWWISGFYLRFGNLGFLYTDTQHLSLGWLSRCRPMWERHSWPNQSCAQTS